MRTVIWIVTFIAAFAGCAGADAQMRADEDPAAPAARKEENPVVAARKPAPQKPDDVDARMKALEAKWEQKFAAQEAQHRAEMAKKDRDGGEKKGQKSAPAPRMIVETVEVDAPDFTIGPWSYAMTDSVHGMRVTSPGKCLGNVTLGGAPAFMRMPRNGSGELLMLNRSQEFPDVTVDVRGRIFVPVGAESVTVRRSPIGKYLLMTAVPGSGVLTRSAILGNLEEAPTDALCYGEGEAWRSFVEYAEIGGVCYDQQPNPKIPATARYYWRGDPRYNNVLHACDCGASGSSCSPLS